MSQMLYQSPAIERLGIPAYNWWNGALHGVARAGVATMFPQAIGLAATFDRELIQEIGDVVSTEGRAKFNEFSRRGDHGIYKGLTFWAPNVNIFRDPRWGRGHETYGEDPYLTGELGCAYIKGLQGPDPEHPKAAACAKHFAVHSGPEALRHQFNAQVSKHDLYDTYLYAFKRCVKDAKVEAVMGAYNRVNGEPACGSKGLQNGLEKISKILMSALLIMIVVLAVHSFTLSGAGEGIRFYLIPNLKTVKEVGFGNVCISRHEPGILYLKPWSGCHGDLRQLHGKISYVSWRGTSDLRTGYIRCHYGRTDYFPGRFRFPPEQSNFATKLLIQKITFPLK